MTMRTVLKRHGVNVIDHISKVDMDRAKKILADYKDQNSIVQGMLELISSFRALQMVAHHAHHLVKGPSFFEDHSFFGKLYNKADEYYDNVAERFIGLGFESHFNLGEILAKVAEKSVVDADHYKNVLNLINGIDEVINDMTASGLLSEGTVQLLGDIADNLEVYKYKINRRVG